MITVSMHPALGWFGKEESGMRRVVEAYNKYLPKYGIQIAEGQNAPYDLLVGHAGIISKPDVSHLHGLYWSADYNCHKGELHTNARIVKAIRHSTEVTVPSRWVQKTFERDMRFSPHIVPHGIETKEWAHNHEHEEYVLWNKNRKRDVCSPEPIANLAAAFKTTKFKTTFAPYEKHQNIDEIGLQPHDDMKELIQRAGVYLSTTKETFGIGILEALAAGVPVLGFDHGGNSEIVQHGVNGYLAAPGSYTDLRRGLAYCIKHRKVLGNNAKKRAKEFDWDTAVKQVAEIYHKAYKKKEPSVSVVIPVYNYGDKVERAIKSAVEQELKPEKVVVVDDGSTDDTKERVHAVIEEHRAKQEKACESVEDTADEPCYNIATSIEYVYQENSGVAIARNTGFEHTDTKYVACLDADDKIAPEFLDVCVDALEKDNSLGIAYTGLYNIKPNGEEGMSKWPDEWGFDDQLQKHNQVPTCNVMRRKMLDRLGGYRQRYAPQGAGAEDAELWLRSGAYGWKAKKVDNRGLFIYSWLSGRVSGNPDYQKVDWLAWHPWAKDKYHPFASYATPKNDISHLVRQYDEPEISVIIPVGPGHVDELINALDSLEAQTFRNWEAVVVFDGVKNTDKIEKAYPYPIYYKNGDRPKGAGWARNKGVELSSSQLLLYLDADDWLYSDTIEIMLHTWRQNEGIVYSDYVEKAAMTQESADDFGERLEQYQNGIGIVRYNSSPYDCKRAQNQPPEYPDPPYIWNLITSLTPKEWHDEIGGFDESMETWEDWDYWIRMAKADKCFYRIPEDLVVYNFDTGTRRAKGSKIGKQVSNYLRNKYKEIENMGCRGCSDKKQNKRRVIEASAEDYILARYNSPNEGQHSVYGPITNEYYNYRAGGDVFYVHKDDVNSEKFTPVQRTNKHKPEPKEPPSPPKPIEKTKPDDLTQIPGVSDRIAASLQSLGINSFSELAESRNVLLMQIKGVGEATANKFIDKAKELE